MGGEDGQTTTEPQAQGMYAGPSRGLGLTVPRRNHARPSVAAGALLAPQSTQGRHSTSSRAAPRPTELRRLPREDA